MLASSMDRQLAPIRKEGNITKVEILGSSSIHVGYKITNHIAKELPEIAKFSTLVIISDKNLDKVHAESLKQELEKELIPAGKRVFKYIIQPGEQSKSRATKAAIEDYLFSLGCTRDTILLGLGGGVIGDLVGYVAATFMRGIPVIHLPTSLLSMVDSSIGGKTAIDVPAGKNLIGAFHQPLRVYVDLEYLKTLPKREFFNGMAEVIKTAAIADKDEFDRLENEFENIQRLIISPNSVTEKDKLALEKVVLSSIRFKAFVVTEDEKEAGLRGLLNFGHSIGHAIEAILSPSLLHGECVAVGMIQEAEVSRSLGFASQVTIARLSRVLKLYKLPISVYDPVINNLLSSEQKNLSVSKLMDIIKLDKKNIAGKKRIVLLKDIGSTTNPFPEFVNDEELVRAMSNGIVINLTKSLDPEQYREVSVPGSKSISNRALLLAALGEGTVKLTGLLHSDDTQVMLEALRLLGNIKYEFQDGGETLVIEGCGGPSNFKAPNQQIYLGNAGTAVRFLTTICASVVSDGDIILTGNERMKLRPIAPLVTALSENGCNIEYLENEGYLPLKFRPTGLKGGVIELSANISSQYVSSILLSSPYTKEGVTLKLVGGHVISQPYIDMTIAMMKQFNVEVQRISEKEYFIPPSKYVNPKSYLVEGDASSATYPLSLAAITGTTVKVTNLGYESLQGDAQFAIKVLKPMGCEVSQTATTTTVTGPSPGNLKCLPTIDMEPMTDAFLTASVLAAVANHHPTDPNITEYKTDITGIANQRVKECNRILAMVTELAKFGVYASELEDGISIRGIKLTDLKVPEDGIDCYDDHRVAMSFSLLGTQVNNTVIKEKRCVEKTYPQWWDVLRHKLNVPLNGYDVPVHSDEVTKSKVDPSNSVILIGMRGAGKTTFGESLANNLNFEFLDLDHHFEKVYQTSVKQLVADKGWDEFRTLETKLLKDSLKEYSKNTVISCGGGIVELKENRELLTKYKENGIVVHLRRDINEIQNYLDIDNQRPKYANQESIDAVFLRREPYYEECSNYEFVSINYTEDFNLTKEQHFQHLKYRFTKFIQNARGIDINSLPKSDKPSFFVCLSNPDVKPLLKDIKQIVQSSNAVEIRVDQLIKDKDLNDDKQFKEALNYVRQQVSLLKYQLDEYPIIYTLRTKIEAGVLDDKLDSNKLITLLDLGLRLGSEVIDVQLSFNSKVIEHVTKNKGNSKILASYHDLDSNLDWNSPTPSQLIKKADFADIIKLISTAKEQEHNFKLQTFIKEYHTKNTKPLIAMNMGPLGQLSRVLNNYLTPVTHPKLTSAASGQLSSKQILEARHVLGLLPTKKFYLFGSPISSSPSPQYHTKVFNELGLPYKLYRYETGNVEEVKKILQSEEFAGACVTIPLKVDVIPLLDQLSNVAKFIGAVNTISKENNKLIGHNTDWLGIRNPLIKNLIELDLLPVNNKQALILGAGGTSRAAVYAAYELGFNKIYLFNRSEERIQQLINDLKGKIQFEAIVGEQKLNELIQSQHNIVAVIDTLPGNAEVVNSQFINTIFPQNKKGVLVKLAYKKYSNGGSKELDLNFGDNVAVVHGLQCLNESGRPQTEIWTGGIKPSYEFVEKAIQEALV